MLYRTRGVILRTVKYGETSVIADIFTEQKGVQTFMIHGVRKAKASTPPSYLQLLNLVELVGYHKDGRKMHHLKELRLDHVYASIPFDMRKSAVITSLAEICSRCITTAESQPALFSFLRSELIGYDHPDQFDRDFIIRFLTSMAHLLGFGIELHTLTPEDRYIDLLEGQIVRQPSMHPYLMGIEDAILWKKITESDPGTLVVMPTETRRRIVDLLITYYQLHIESLREVKSIQIWREIM